MSHPGERSGREGARLKRSALGGWPVVNLDDVVASSACTDPMITATKEVRRVSRQPTAPGRSSTLAQIIEADIIPRLLLANGGRDAASDAVPLDVDAEDIDAFARMMIELDVAQANLIIRRVLERGVTLETVMLDLLAPTAQRLGAMWVDDDCTFTDVTVGLCALQNLLRAYASGDERSVQPPPGDGSVLLAALPGEQHTFGVLMLETFFRRAGWDVVGMPLALHDDIVSAASRRPFAIAGLSISRKIQLDGLRDMIATIRKRSANREIIILVGGRVFNENPGLFRSVGADMTARDGQQAVIASQHHLWSTVQTH